MNQTQGGDGFSTLIGIHDGGTVVRGGYTTAAAAAVSIIT